MDLKINHELRPCMVAICKGGKEERALFHCWTQWSNVIAPSVMVGGHSGGQLSETYGLVEFEDGTIKRVYPGLIRFLDHYFSEYDWRDRPTDSCYGCFGSSFDDCASCQVPDVNCYEQCKED